MYIKKKNSRPRNPGLQAVSYLEKPIGPSCATVEPALA